MTNMKKTEVPWIGNIPNDWNIIRFKNIAIHKKQVAKSNSIDYERLALTLNGVIKRGKDDSEGLQPKEFDSYQIIKKGDFIFKMIDLKNVNTSRVGLSDYQGLVSPAYLRFEPKKGFNSRFFYYYLMSLYYECVFNNLAGNGVRSALTAEELGLLQCPYPNILDENKIVKTIDIWISKINSLIDNEQRQIEKLKAYKQSLISEIVTKGLDPDVPMKDSGVEWIGKIPEGWDLKRLKYCYQNKEIKYSSGSYKYIALENIESFSGNYIASLIKYDLKESIEADKGDVIFGKLRPYLAKTFSIQEKSYVSSEFAVFFSLHGNKSDYLKFLFLSPSLINIINSYTYGTKMPRANIIDIKNLTIPLPSISQQEAIIIYLNKMNQCVENIITNKLHKIEKLISYKHSIIYEYVTGKREV